MSSRRLIVGLGNPGAQYEFTRHNLGFMLIDLIARESGCQVKRRECRALVGRAVIEGLSIDLVKPLTFMNDSGNAVACLLSRQNFEQDLQEAVRDMIVISDDFALPFGTIRLRARGSAGGHNGLKSLVAALDSNEFIRLRIGIQPDHPVGDMSRYVLSEFSNSERLELDSVLERSALAVRAVLKDGVEPAMAQFN